MVIVRLVSVDKLKTVLNVLCAVQVACMMLLCAIDVVNLLTVDVSVGR